MTVPRGASSRGRVSGILLRAGAAAVAVAILAIVMTGLGGVVDDTYIFCRYADNIASGRGMVFNPGERVEGFTSPAFTLLTALGVVLGIPAVDAACLISALAAIAMVALLAFYRRDPSARSWAFPIAALLTASAIPVGLWASAGMDETLFALAVAISALMLDRHFAGPREPGSGQPPPPPLTVWLFAGLAVWIRPEGMLIPAVLFGLSFGRLWRRRALPRTWIAPALAFVPFAALTLFRLLYFGEWLPNTYHAKMGGGGVGLWLGGARYLLDAAILMAPILLWIAVGSYLSRKRGFGAPGLWLAAALAAGILLEGGDFFPMFRFAVPLVPLLAIAAGRAFELLLPKKPAMIAAAAGLCVVNLGWGLASPSTSSCEWFSNTERFVAEVEHTRLFSRVGRSLRKELGPDRSVGVLTVGAIPYWTGWRTVDMLGLTDKHIARRESSLGEGIVGHEKFDTDYLLERKPDLFLLHPWIWREPVPLEAVVSSPHVHDAQRDLLDSDRFHREYRLSWQRVEGGHVALFGRRDGG